MLVQWIKEPSNSQENGSFNWNWAFLNRIGIKPASRQWQFYVPPLFCCHLRKSGLVLSPLQVACSAASAARWTSRRGWGSRGGPCGKRVSWSWSTTGLRRSSSSWSSWAAAPWWVKRRHRVARPRSSSECYSGKGSGGNGVKQQAGGISAWKTNQLCCGGYKSLY